MALFSNCGDNEGPDEATTASALGFGFGTSNFEILDGNLKLDNAAPNIDWAVVNETRKEDLPTGTTDDSFGQGTKEDTEVPTVVAGSIPPNKSDLLNFGVYFEDQGTQQYLHLFWHRVQEPQGTTNMDFEFNKSTVISSNTKTPVRTAGDLLVMYDLSKGGTTPTLWLSTWVTTGTPSLVCEASNTVPCWGKRVNLTTSNKATGSINSSTIAASDADGLGTISPRTFGEATLDFTAITGGGCNVFGSAYLKSRSSDSFTSEIKDFISPASLSINPCGAIKVTKTRKHAADGSGDHAQSGVSFTVNGVTKTTDTDGVACFDGLRFAAQGGTSYSVTETVPTGYVVDGSNPKSVTVDNAALCSDTTYAGETVAFKNIPLTNVTVSVDSKIDGGTASTITCGTDTASTGANGDGSLTLSNKQPGTISCTIVIDP